MENCLEKGRKLCRKRRKCWLSTFSPFPTMFLTGSFVMQGRQKSGLCGKELTPCRRLASKFLTCRNSKDTKFGKG